MEKINSTQSYENFFCHVRTFTFQVITVSTAHTGVFMMKKIDSTSALS